MAIIIDEIEEFPKTLLKTNNGKDVWVISKGMVKPLRYRIIDAVGVLLGKYEAFRYLEQKDFDKGYKDNDNVYF